MSQAKVTGPPVLVQVWFLQDFFFFKPKLCKALCFSVTKTIRHFDTFEILKSASTCLENKAAKLGLSVMDRKFYKDVSLEAGLP